MSTIQINNRDTGTSRIYNVKREQGTHENPIRYESLDKSDPEYKAKFRAQLDKFEEDAKSGKVLCLTDLMCNAGM